MKYKNIYNAIFVCPKHYLNDSNKKKTSQNKIIYIALCKRGLFPLG